MIYTTVAPRTSKIFITSLEKAKQGGDVDEVEEASGTQFITLKDLTEKSKKEKANLAAKL